MHKRTGLEKLSKITWVGCNGTLDIHKKKRFHRLYNQFGLCCLCSLHALLKAEILKRFVFVFFFLNQEFFIFLLVKILTKTQVEDLGSRQSEGWVIGQHYFPYMSCPAWTAAGEPWLPPCRALRFNPFMTEPRFVLPWEGLTLGSQQLSWIRLVFHLGTPKITFSG